MKMNKDEFEILVKEKLIPSFVGEDFERALTTAQDFLNPYIENSTIEEFNFDYLDDPTSTELTLCYEDGSVTEFSIYIKENE